MGFSRQKRRTIHSRLLTITIKIESSPLSPFILNYIIALVTGVMAGLNVIFGKLAKFTGDGDVDLRQWLKSFERCCLIAEKTDDLVKGQLSMLCVEGRAKATLDQFEDEKKSAEKYSDLKTQSSTVFDSATDRAAKMTEFEREIEKQDESEDELMTNLLQLFRAANPEAKTEEINRAVKRKFLQGISDELRRNIFIFCNHPFDDEVSHRDLLKACRDAAVHLATTKSSLASDQAVSPAVLAATNPPPTSSSSNDATLQAILSLSHKFEEQTRLTQQQLNEQQEQINMLRHPPTARPF